MTRTSIRLLFLVAVLGVLSACKPPPPVSDGSFTGQWSYEDSRISVDQAFPEPWLNATAHCIVERESHYDPNAKNGQYRGIWQEGFNYNGTIAVTNDGNVFNPYTASQVARIIFDSVDSRGRQRMWSAWSTAGGCA